MLIASPKMERLITRGEICEDIGALTSACTIHLPPLRDVPEEIPYLWERFLRRVSEMRSVRKPAYSPRINSSLATYAFPGNARELYRFTDHFIQGFFEGDFMIRPEVLRESLGAWKREQSPPSADNLREVFANMKTLPTLDRLRDALAAEALARCEDSRELAARMVGIALSEFNEADLSPTQ